MKKVIVGAGKAGEEVFAKNNGNIDFFVDNKTAGQEKLGKKIVSFDTLRNAYDDKVYEILIASYDLNMKLDMSDQLEWLGIMNYKDGLGYVSQCLHVYGVFPNIQYEFDREYALSWRMSLGTIPMLKEAFNLFGNYFIDKQLDFYVFCEDVSVYAERLRNYLGVKHIFAYYNEYSYSETVIPIPDMRFYMGLDKRFSGDLTGSIDALREAGEKAFEDSRAFWIGNIANDQARRKLYLLGKEHSDKLRICGEYAPNGVHLWGDNPISLCDFTKYKYLIDVRGSGWTDRIKWLLAMQRPVFIIDRPYKEYYMNDLVPMKHYVPVKEDMSDLIEKYDYMERNPELYSEICKNATAFVDKNFTKRKVYGYIKDIILKYGVCM